MSNRSLTSTSIIFFLIIGIFLFSSQPTDVIKISVSKDKITNVTFTSKEVSIWEKLTTRSNSGDYDILVETQYRLWRFDLVGDGEHYIYDTVQAACISKVSLYRGFNTLVDSYDQSVCR